MTGHLPIGNSLNKNSHEIQTNLFFLHTLCRSEVILMSEISKYAGAGFALVVVLFILLIIVGAGGFGGSGGYGY